jgi:hypothetical protein
MKRNVLIVLLIIVVASGLLWPTPPAIARPDGANGAASGTVSPTHGPPGTVFSFTLSGFYPEEQVGVWLSGPNDTRLDLEQRFFADSTGHLSLRWTAPADVPGGAWSLRAQGFATREEVIVPFTIEGPALPAAITPSFLVQPAHSGAPGTTFTFVGRGRFQPWEQVASWFVEPDGTTRSSQQGISADGSGQIYRVWTAPTDAPAGEWIFRTRGRNSGFQLDIPFSIVRAGEPGDSEPPPQPGSSVSPPAGPPATTFVFTASGFEPGERLELWLTMPDTTSRDFRAGEWLYADDDTGTFQTEWTAPADVPGGTWYMNIRGARSRKHWEIPFTIEAPASNTTRSEQRGNTSPSTTQPVLSVSPAQAPLGTRFQFRATGYKPGETVFFWATNPDGHPMPNHKEARADANGLVVWSWEVPHDEQPGLWTMTTRGDASRREGQVTFIVTDPAPQPEAIRMEPENGKPGTTFHFFAAGFYAGEEMSFWLTPPEPYAERQDQPGTIVEDMQADEQGEAWWNWTAPDQTAEGVWHMTARGDESRVERIIAFSIVRDTPLLPLYGVEPASGPPGTTFRFFARDIPTDHASYWLTRPDGTVIPDDHTDFQNNWILNAVEQDTFVWEWTAPADAPPGVWLMVIRSRPDQPDYDPSKNKDTRQRQHEKSRYVENRRDSVINHREYGIRFMIASE